MSISSEEDFIITVGSAKSLKDRKKHTDPDCRYVGENTRPYRESDPELDVCQYCSGEFFENRKERDDSYYRLALESE